VSEPTPLLDRERIEAAFHRLGDRLAKRGVVADIYVFGGAAMALAYDSRRVTRDEEGYSGGCATRSGHWSFPGQAGRRFRVLAAFNL
jgi:hypothetical protein